MYIRVNSNREVPFKVYFEYSTFAFIRVFWRTWLFGRLCTFCSDETRRHESVVVF